jgi:hypothetical protein
MLESKATNSRSWNGGMPMRKRSLFHCSSIPALRVSLLAIQHSSWFAKMDKSKEGA